MVESALPLKHISLVELITTERTGALERKKRWHMYYRILIYSVGQQLHGEKRVTVKCQRPQEQFGLTMRSDTELRLTSLW